MKLQELKKQLQEAHSELFTQCGVFWAFSDEQFMENKTPLKEGEKYVSIGQGGYVPKGNLNQLEQGMKANREAYEKALKTHNLRLKEIAYQFGNHECYYTGDWQDVLGYFPDVKPEVIQRVYRIQYKKHLAWCEATGN